MYVRAVWIEGKDNCEEEGVVPDSWVVKDTVYWPPGPNAEKSITNKTQPGKNWMQFKLKKIKFSSESRKECDEFDATTAAETEEDEEMSIEKRRNRKKRVFEHYITTGVFPTPPKKLKPTESSKSQSTLPTNLLFEHSSKSQSIDSSKSQSQPLSKTHSRQINKSQAAHTPKSQSELVNQSRLSNAPVSQSTKQVEQLEIQSKLRLEHLSWSQSLQSSKSQSHHSSQSKHSSKSRSTSKSAHLSKSLSLHSKKFHSPNLSQSTHSLKSTHSALHSSKSQPTYLAKPKATHFKSLTPNLSKSQFTHSSNSTHSSKFKSPPSSRVETTHSSKSKLTHSLKYNSTHSSKSNSLHLSRSRSPFSPKSHSKGSYTKSHRYISYHRRSRSHSRQRTRSYSKSRSPSYCQRSRSQTRHHSKKRSRSKSQSRHLFHRMSRSRSQSSERMSRHSSPRMSMSISPFFRSRSRSRSPTISRSSSHRSPSRSRSRSLFSLSPSPFGKHHSTPNERITENVYPIPTARFQKRVLYLLTELKSDIARMKKGGGVLTDRNQNENLTLYQASTMDEFHEMNRRSKDPQERQKMVQILSIIGGFNTKDNVKKIMESAKPPDLLARFKWSGGGEKLAFKATGVCGLVIASAMKTGEGSVTEQDIVNAIGTCLKYAPDRRGGGGRKQGDN